MDNWITRFGHTVCFALNYVIKMFNIALGLWRGFDPQRGLSGTIFTLAQPISLKINKCILSFLSVFIVYYFLFSELFLTICNFLSNLSLSVLSSPSSSCRCIPRSPGKDMPHICSQTLDSCSAAVKSSSTPLCQGGVLNDWINHFF